PRRGTDRRSRGPASRPPRDEGRARRGPRRARRACPACAAGAARGRARQARGGDRAPRGRALPPPAKDRRGGAQTAGARVADGRGAAPAAGARGCGAAGRADVQRGMASSVAGPGRPGPARAAGLGRRKLVASAAVLLAALSDGQKAGIAGMGAAFMIFALVSSFVIPRRMPDFPGKRGVWPYVGVVVTFFVAMMAVVVFVGKEK